jgi:GTP-binding protein
MSRFPQVQFMLSVAAPPQFPPDQGAEVAFAGRSNAGKSSAINAITERKALARISKTPGRTQLLNYFELKPNERIVDLPGYGYAAVHAGARRKWGPLIVDSRRGMREEDVELVEWAQPERRAVHVVLAKCDKLKRTEQMAVLREAQAILGAAGTVQLFSAHEGKGVDEAQKALIAALRPQVQRIALQAPST